MNKNEAATVEWPKRRQKPLWTAVDKVTWPTADLFTQNKERTQDRGRGKHREREREREGEGEIGKSQRNQPE